MADIIQFPIPASKFGYKRVKGRSRATEHPDQLELFSQPAARILEFAPEVNSFERALLLDEQGDPQAAELYRKAIAEDQNAADAYCNLGILESQKGNTSKAIDCFTTSLKCDPRHTEAHYNLGNLYFDVNNLQLAQVHYQVAAEVDPGFANVYFNLALVHAINSEFAAAIDALTQYQKLAGEKARDAEDLLRNLKTSLATKEQPQLRSI